MILGHGSARLTGKRILVTAAAQGIGRAIAERLAAEGGQVVATDINADRLRDLASLTATNLAFDATDEHAVSAALADAQFDVLVNCVGWVHHGTIEHTSYDDWRRSFQINV